MAYDATGALYANMGLPSPNFLGNAVSTTYTATGTIAATDRLSLANSASAITLTLGAGVRDGQPLILKNLGAGTVTLDATIDGTAGSTSVTSLSALRLIWDAALATWLSV